MPSREAEALKAPPEPLEFGPLTRTDFVRYQGAAGDMQPVHHDEEYARNAGYPGVFSVGMLHAGLLATWAADWLGPANVRRYRARFKEQAWPGDVLTCSGVVVREYEEGGEHLVELELECKRQTGGVAVQAWATFAVPAEDGSGEDSSPSSLA
jgi:acyl dehydratase